MRLIISGAVIASLLLGVWWFWENNSSFRQVVEQYVENGEFTTLEVRYTPEQIVDLHRKELMANNNKTIHSPELLFQPYAMLDVKYTTNDKKTKEGVILWSLVNGEMVVDSSTWEQTSGFEDAINAGASPSDFKVLNILAKNKGKMTQEQMQKELHVEAETLGPWLDSVKQKHLVVSKGAELQLHFQNPRFLVTPQTRMNQWLVSKPYNHAQKISRKYSSSQIEKTARAAFGSDFSIRQVKEIFIPIYSIETENADGSILTTQWNALNGERIVPKYLSP